MQQPVSHVIPFRFDAHEVRAVLLDGEPWWVGKDVCQALDYVNPSDAMKQHCKGVAKRYPLPTAGGTVVTQLKWSRSVPAILSQEAA